MSLQTTLVLCKPDAVKKQLIGTILQRFDKEGFRFAGIKMMQLDDAILHAHYAHIAHYDFFPTLLEFMQQTPVLVLAIEGNNAIERVRNLVGPTDSQQAPKGTIRGDFGESKMFNICHASDSPQSAAIELERFFHPQELFSY